MEKKYRRSIILLLLSCFICLSGCDVNNSTDQGFLKGKISIGPICPVERIPPDSGCLPTAETYKAFQVIVYSPDGKHMITKLNPSLEGAYLMELPQGSYLVNLEKVTVAGGSNLPSVISINPDDTTFFDIVIDTGIR